MDTITTRVVEDLSLEYLPVHKDLVGYRLTTTRTVGQHEPHVHVVEGFTTKSKLAVVEAGTSYIPPYRAGHVILFGSPETQAQICSHGWLDNKMYETLYRDKHPYARFAAGEVTADDVLLVDHAANMIYDVEGRPVPAAIFFDYINGRMDGGTYDLERALTILKARGDVRFARHATGEDLDEVLPIPSYNVSSGRTHHISFIWMPEVEDYRRMWEHCVKNYPKSPTVYRYQAVFELDLLGLRAGGAARSSEFYGPCIEEE